MTIGEVDQTRVERQIRLAVALPRCDGFGMRRLTRSALQWLDANHEIVNALNVFPVPDGDTGTNMLLTMQAAYKEIENSTETNASKVAQAVAQGALMGARGNSGVILSQIWRGFARGLDGAEAFDSGLVVQALLAASATAYRGVVKPVEGTILTVIKDSAAAAQAAYEASGHTADLRTVLEAVVEGAQASVARTPELLPLLKQAGVVDSGGKGLALIFEGMLRYLKGQQLDQSPLTVIAPLSLEAVGTAMNSVEPGQEWEVVVDFRPRVEMNLPNMYSTLEAMGTSIQVGEGDGLYRVHIHLLKSRRLEPIELAEEWGTVVNVHMENLLDQVETLQGSGPQGSREEALPVAGVQPGQLAVVAVSPGLGLSRLMGSLGAAAIVGGGQTKNPSTEEFLKAIDGLPTDKIIVLPNNKNIILAAQQAASLSSKQVRVVPSRTVPQGIAALLNLVPDGDLDTVSGAMERATAAVETGEVTTASRTVEINGVAVSEGDIIGLCNGVLAVGGQSIPDVVMRLLEAMSAGEHELITLYSGAEVSADAADQVAAAVRAVYPEPKYAVEIHAGGQPYYHYILSVE
jgi:DAK2 domain fusion protein YloV